MRPTSTGAGARRVAGRVAVVIGVCYLAGCQEGLTVGVRNECGETIGADLSSGTSNPTIDQIDDGDVRTYTFSSGVERVRFALDRGGEVVVTELAVDDLRAAPDGADHDRVIIVAGDRCPDH